MGSLRRIPDRNLQDKPKDISNDIVKTNTRQHEDSSNSIAIEVRLDQNGCAKTGAVHLDVTPPDDDYHKEAYINDDEIHKTVNDDIINISPDGGWGWVVCFGLFILIALQDGTVIAFGVLQLEFLDYFGESKSKTALISSLNIGISMVMGIFVAMLLERFSCRQVIILGAIVTMIAFTLSVFAYSVTYLILTIGIMAGIGMGLSYIPATVIVCLYFNKKRALAMGLASSGSGVGQLVYAFLVGPLIEEYSWRGTLLIMAGLLFHMAICGALFRPLVPRQNGVNVHTWRMHCLNIFRTLKCLYFTKSNVDSTTVVINPNRDIHIDGKNEANASEIMLLKGTNNLTTSRDVVSVPMTLQHVQAHLPNHLENDNDEDGSGTSLRHGCGVNEDGIATDYTLGYDTPDIIRQGYLNPYLRKDILYCGSLKSLPEFSETGSMQSFLVSMTNLSYWGESLSIQKIESLHEQDMISIQPDIVKVENPKLLDFSLFRDKTYLLLLTAMFMWATVTIVFLYLPDLAITKGLSKTEVSSVLSMLGISNMIGRIFTGWLSDRPCIGAFPIYNTALVVCGIAIIVFPWCETVTHFAACSIVFGLSIASMLSLRVVILVDALGISKLSQTFGICALFQGISFGVSPPLAGALYDATGDFVLTFTLVGALTIMAAILSVVVHCSVRKRRHIQRHE